MPDEGRPTPTLGLIKEACAQAVEFAACLLELGRAELGEKFALIGRAIGFLAGAAVGIGIAVVFLLIGLAHFLIALGLRPDVSFCIIGGVLAALCIGIALKARSDLSAAGLKGSRTLHQFRSFVRSIRPEDSDGR